MVETLREEVRQHLAESSKHIDHAKSVINDACEDFTQESKRAVKAGRRAAEDLVDHAELTVRRFPKSSVAGGVLAGFALGFCLGWLLSGRD